MLTHVKEALPNFEERGDGNMVEVHVELENGQRGKAFFGCSGAPGEPLGGQFWTVQKELASKVMHWSYLN